MRSSTALYCKNCGDSITARLFGMPHFNFSPSSFRPSGLSRKSDNSFSRSRDNRLRRDTCRNHEENFSLKARSPYSEQQPHPPQASPEPRNPIHPGAPAAYGTAPAVGPKVSATTFAEAEKLVQTPLTEKDRAQAAGNRRSAMAPLNERRAGPRKVEIPPTTAPWSRWDSALPGTKPGPEKTSSSAPSLTCPSPTDEADSLRTRSSAFAPDRNPQTHQRAPHQYLPRSHRAPQSKGQLRHHPHTRPRPRTGPQKADAEIASGHYRGPMARHPLGRKRSPRHRQHPHHLGRRAIRTPHPHSRSRGVVIFFRDGFKITVRENTAKETIIVRGTESQTILETAVPRDKKSSCTAIIVLASIELVSLGTGKTHEEQRGDRFRK